jgi:hypothetical protein
MWFHSSRGGVHRRAKQHHAGVVDDGVEAVEALDRLLHGGDRLLLVRDVGLDDEGVAAVGRDGPGELVEPVLAPGDERHRRALSRERLGRGGADAAAGAGDEGGRAVESSGSSCCCHASSYRPSSALERKRPIRPSRLSGRRDRRRARPG